MQKRTWILGFLLFSTVAFVQAQDRYYTKTGKITLYSHAPLETIEAVNKTAGAVLDAKTGALQFAVLMRGFEFRKALMQEHFNENYVESDKYPKGEFKGSIVNNGDINYAQDGTYKATVKGQLSMHGITRPLETTATLTIRDGKIDATSGFPVQLSDYRISIPAIVKDKINNSVRVTVEVQLSPLNK